MKYTVFCGSSSGSRACFKSEAFHLGTVLAARNIQVVFGGCKVGLMGAVADGALSRNGIVIGVFPDFLKDKEVLHQGISELILVESMYQRKALMFDLSQGFIALPGGLGTLEELFEALTFSQLNLHQKPIGLLNLEGFFDPLLTMVEQMSNQGFLDEKVKDLFVVAQNVNELLDKMASYTYKGSVNWVQMPV
ncbi:LOG family protein [Myroides sp. LJL119]